MVWLLSRSNNGTSNALERTAGWLAAATLGASTWGRYSFFGFLHSVSSL